MGKETVINLKNMYFRDEFRESAMKIQGLTDNDLKRLAENMKKSVMNSKQKNPVKMFFKIIEQSIKKWDCEAHFPILGDWHHFLVPGVVLTSMRNNNYEISNKDISEGMFRAEQARVSCGFTGVCGGANSIGIVAAITKKVTPLHDKDRQELMRIAARTLLDISKIKRRCCLISSYKTLKQTVAYLAGINYPLPVNEIICPYSFQNIMCVQDRCPFK